jgi:isoquinoline 1-oxidoreductase subunit beta
MPVKSVRRQGSPDPLTPSRRQFLQTTAVVAGALVVAARPEISDVAAAATAQDAPQPNAFIRIAADNSVTVIVKHLDKGQGVTTGLATIVADELDADWTQIRTEFAPADATRYNNLAFGRIQGTGGSTSIANSWAQLRYAAAAAKAMLKAAAAESWHVPASEISVEKGVLVHAGTGQRASFGELAAKAATMPVPVRVALKEPRDWIYIGKKVPRVDSIAKTTGKAIFALDVKRPGMLTAVLTRPPRFGSTVKSFDAKAAKAQKGVVEVVQIPQGVAVLATDTWSAIKGRQELKIQWDDATAEKRSSEEILAEYRKLAAQPGKLAARRGDAVAAVKDAKKVIEAEFLFPYLAHAPLEPLNATIELAAPRSGRVRSFKLSNRRRQQPFSVSSRQKSRSTRYGRADRLAGVHLQTRITSPNSPRSPRQVPKRCRFTSFGREKMISAVAIIAQPLCTGFGRALMQRALSSAGITISSISRL